jgi:uncharacterized membrane protein
MKRREEGLYALIYAISCLTEISVYVDDDEADLAEVANILYNLYLVVGVIEDGSFAEDLNANVADLLEGIVLEDTANDKGLHRFPKNGNGRL